MFAFLLSAHGFSQNLDLSLPVFAVAESSGMSDSTQFPRLPRFTICGLGEVRSHSRESTFSHVVSIWDVGTRSDGPPCRDYHVGYFWERSVHH
jgi:hypothetical protein